MESFYMTVIAIAAIILILALTYVGILLYYTSATDVFPPTPASTCPDYWQSDPSGCIFPKNIDSKNRGSLATVQGNDGQINTNTETAFSDTGTDKILMFRDVSPNTQSIFNFNHTGWKNKYGKNSELCNKKYWATMNQISWDGVTNSNQC